MLIYCSKNQTDFDELCELARSAHIQIAGTVIQRQKQPDNRFYLGLGKIQELQKLIIKTKANLVIFNDSLTGIQSRNLSEKLKTSIWERNQLILKIFSERARSYEGKLQVELAQKLDELSRTRGAWLGSLSRQGGGVGAGRGPGEKALETDRRQIQKRIHFLRKKIKNLRNTRSQQRKLRKQACNSFALIGYTNSGKSSLLNCLCKTKIPTEDQLFLTLDPTTRKVFIPGLSASVLTDTVGFIQNLPTNLISAFKATLEESSFADVLLHVIDLSNPNMQEQIHVVDQLIKEFKWDNKPIIYVYNKIDKAPPEKIFEIQDTSFHSMVSAKSGEGTHHLLKEMKRAYLSLNKKIELFFPKEYKFDHLNYQAETHINTK